MNLPNKLTVFRIILVPIMVIVSFFNIPGNLLGVPMTMIVLDLIFIIASITDKLDGYLARSRNEVTTFGKFLDPIADKILVIAAMILFVGMGRLPAWIPIIVIFREFIVSGFRLIAVEQNGKVIAASFWGKLKTATQMVALIIMFIDNNAYCQCLKGTLTGLPLAINIVSSLLMTISLIATIFSGIDYLKGGKDLLKDR